MSHNKQQPPIYLDHAATTPVRPEVVETIAPYFSDNFGNPSSIHMFGQRAKKALEDAREIVAECIGAAAKEIFFTSGGTESDNLAIKGTAHALGSKGRHIVTSKTEHYAVLSTCKHMEEEGFEVTYLPVDKSGIVDLETLQSAVRQDTILISVMLANNETGTIQPIPEIARIAENAGVAVHTDAVQAIGKMPVDVDELAVDLLSLSGHKIYGPKGIGALYVREGTRIDPIIHGGHHERNKRAGTENVAQIVGLAKAMELARNELQETSRRLAGLRDRLEGKIHANIAGSHVNGHPDQRLPNILNIGFESVEAEILLLTLDMRGIAVSTGSACTSGSVEPSHVLKAMNVDPGIVQGSLRFSLGRGNTEAQIDYVVKCLIEIIARQREISPSYARKAEG